jgi:DNA-binding protein H-NS
MARSLAKIHEQIARLQKEAASIQFTVIARIRREIAQFGLTVEHLFGAGESAVVGIVRRSKAGAQKTKPAKTDKPAKFADGQGNTWHGVGKRPAWIHEAIAAGRSLDDFLMSKTATSASAGTSKKAGNEGPQALRSRKTAAPAKTAAKAAAAAKPARRAPTKKSAAAPVAAKKKVLATQPAKKAPAAKRAAKVSKRAAPAEKVSEQPTA